MFNGTTQILEMNQDILLFTTLGFRLGENGPITNKKFYISRCILNTWNMTHFSLWGLLSRLNHSLPHQLHEEHKTELLLPGLMQPIYLYILFFTRRLTGEPGHPPAAPVTTIQHPTGFPMITQNFVGTLLIVRLFSKEIIQENSWNSYIHWKYGHL